MAFLKNVLLTSAGWTLRKGRLWQMTSLYSERMQLAPASLQFRSRKNGPPFQILYYHRILPKVDPFAIDVITTADFEQQVAMLSSAFNLMTIGQLSDALQSRSIPPKTACITFDDGYQDNFRFAFPILQKYSAPATIFVATDFIGTGKLLWPDRLLATIRHSRQSSVPADFCGHSLPLTTPGQRRATAERLLDWLKQFSPEVRDMHIGRLETVCGRAPKPENRLMLTWDEIRTMSDCGIEFGSHTLSHPILSHTTDGEIEQEISESKTIIENHIDKPVQSFAYPNGRLCDFDERAVAALKACGYSAAVTTCDSANDADVDPYALSRESV
ncbi:MAG: polysaccharide deacetylase family protein, partial [Chitinivibrionales bacterium]